MTRPGRYPQELRERAARLVFEHQGEHPSQWAAITSIAWTAEGGKPGGGAVVPASTTTTRRAVIIANETAHSHQASRAAVRPLMRPPRWILSGASPTDSSRRAHAHGTTPPATATTATIVRATQLGFYLRPKQAPGDRPETGMSCVTASGSLSELPRVQTLLANSGCWEGLGQPGESGGPASGRYGPGEPGVEADEVDASAVSTCCRWVVARPR